MRVKATQLIKTEDVPQEHRPWMSKIIGPINDFINQSIKILNDGIQFPDNYIGKDYVFSFTYQSESISFPQSFLWSLLSIPRALQVVSATENGAPIIAAVAWQFSTDRTIQLTSVVKLTSSPAVELLTAGARYQIRARVTP